MFAMYDRKGWPFGCPFFFDSSRCNKGSVLVLGCMGCMGCVVKCCKGAVHCVYCE